MINNKLEILEERIADDFLPFVRRPGRYIGGEVNQIKKNTEKADLKFALCFPDAYEIAMSHSGIAIIYEILNSLESVVAERCFAPWIDAEEILREKNIPLFSLESKAALGSFDVVGFSLTNELCYTNVLLMLDLANIPFRAEDRDESHPIIIGGANQANCCEPIADVFDMFLIGEGEQAIVELTELIKKEIKNEADKKDILIKCAKKFDYIYVPSLYEIDENTGKIKPLIEGLKTRFENAVVEDFDNAMVPLKPIVPFAEAVHERVSVEVMRGCPGRCRFCQASFCKRPIRYRSVEKIVEIAKKCYLATGFDTVSLLSLSTGDYPEIERLVDELLDYFRDKHVGLSLPSLRVAQQLKLLPKLMTNVRKSGLTIAVEAASEKVREIINKPLKDSDLFPAVKAAWEEDFNQIKIYFMAGLPGETEDDIKRIVHLCAELSNMRKEIDNRPGRINAAISWFVPKPHTPFGWLGQKSGEYFSNAQKTILNEKKKLRIGAVNFKFHDVERSVLESAVGRGDRKLFAVIEAAYKNGARFDLWNECYNHSIWVEAFKQNEMDIDTQAQKSFDADEVLPWEHLGGPDKEYLLGHFKDSQEKMA